MRGFVLCVAGAGMLAGCNKGQTVSLHNATGNQVAQAVSQSGVMTSASMIEPGEWQSRTAVLDMEIPGMPPQFAAQMKQAIAAHNQGTSKSCLTPAEVKQPKEDFFAGHDKSCRYEHFTMGGGKIDVQMVCKEEESTQTMNMIGTYTPTSYSMDMSSNATGGRESGMVMKMHVDAQRIGNCTGKES